MSSQSCEHLGTQRTYSSRPWKSSSSAAEITRNVAISICIGHIALRTVCLKTCIIHMVIAMAKLLKNSKCLCATQRCAIRWISYAFPQRGSKHIM